MPVGIKSSGGGTTTLVAESSALNYTATLPANSGTVVTTGSTAAITPTQLNTQAQYTGFKNRIINGAMVIDQRNGGASVIPTVNPQYLVDRFSVENSVASKFAYQQNAAAVTPPVGFINYLGATSQSAYAIGAADYFLLQQKIEGYNVADLGWGTANAKTITLSFWVRSSLTGTFGGNLQNAAANRLYPFSYTISAANTWEQKTITIAGDTTGTWEKTTSTGIWVRWSLGTGSTYLGTSGSWGSTVYLGVTGQVNVVGTSGATFYITGVQLEVGSVATSFDYRPYGTELVLCQRYLPAFLGNSTWFGFGIAINTSQAYCTVQFPVTTRIAPTGITVSAAADFTLTDAVAAAITASSITFNSAGLQSSLLFGTASSAVLTNLRPTTITSNSANSKLFFTGCEL